MSEEVFEPSPGDPAPPSDSDTQPIAVPPAGAAPVGPPVGPPTASYALGALAGNPRLGAPRDPAPRLPAAATAAAHCPTASASLRRVGRTLARAARFTGRPWVGARPRCRRCGPRPLGRWRRHRVRRLEVAESPVRLPIVQPTRARELRQPLWRWGVALWIRQSRLELQRRGELIVRRRRAFGRGFHCIEG